MIVSLVIFLLLTVPIFKEFFIYSIILIIAAIIQYVSYRGELKFNFGHVFFLAIIVQEKIGTVQAIILLVFAGFLPKVYCGELDLKGMITLPLEILLILFCGALNWPIFITGLLIGTINYVATYFIAKLSGETLPEIVTEVYLALFMNTLYFISASGPIEYLLELVIKA